MEQNIKLFNELIDKEIKLDEIKKNHIRSKYAWENLDNNYNNTFYSKKILFNIKNFFMRFIIKYIEFNNRRKFKNLTYEDKKNKIINQKVTTDNNFIIEYYLTRIFQNKIIVTDYGCIDISNFEFNVYLIIKYKDVTSNHYFEKNFNNLDSALSYFDTIIEKNKNKKIDNLIKELSTLIDDECSYITNVKF